MKENAVMKSTLPDIEQLVENIMERKHAASEQRIAKIERLLDTVRKWASDFSIDSERELVEDRNRMSTMEVAVLMKILRKAELRSMADIMPSEYPRAPDDSWVIQRSVMRRANKDISSGQDRWNVDAPMFRAWVGYGSDVIASSPVKASALNALERIFGGPHQHAMISFYLKKWP